MVRSSHSGGFALAYFLLFGMLIAMFVVALLALGRQGLLTSRSGVDSTRALYAAEAGLAQAIARLERDPSWVEGFNEVAMPGHTATFSATFAELGSGGPGDCLNNLAGSTPVDSYHGELTLPAHSALLVVTGSSGMATRTVEALVVTGVDVSVSDALTATGPIRLAGEVAVDGRKSLIDPAPRLANLHHNSDQSGVVGVQYDGGSAPWERISVSGEVTSSSGDPREEVIVFHTSGDVPESRSGVPLKELPRPNIAAMLDDHAGVGGTPIPSTPGLFRLSGNNYYSGDVTINGDLQLRDGARMFVRGNLTINGSVRGKGTVVVGGDSEFYGDAEVSGERSEYIALLSRGSVTLKGFDGESYLRALAAANPEVANRYDDLAYGLRGINDMLAEAADQSPEALHLSLVEDDTRFDYYQAFVGNHPFGVAYGENAGLGPVLDDGRERQYSNARYFVELLEAGPEHSSKRFLRERFQHLDDWFRQAHLQRDGNPATGRTGDSLFDHYADWNPEIDGGLFDSMQSLRHEDWIHLGTTIPGFELTTQRQEIFSDAVAAVQGFDYDRLGNANFKGLIYTNGAFIGVDDVTVLGTVIVNGDPTGDPLELQGVTYQPGEVALSGHSSLTRIDEFFDDGVHNLLGAGCLDIKRWTSR